MSLAFALFGLTFMGFLVIGMPIAFCMGLASLVYLMLGEIGNLTIIFSRMAGAMQNYLYTAVAFFVLASTLMNTTGITTRIFDFANAMVGHLRGGLAQVNVFASVIFAGMTGTALGDAAGLGRIEIHAMREAGYRPSFAAAVTIASSVIGPVVPPSMTMIIYAELAEVSIADLFLGGVIPGLMIGGLLMLFIYAYAHKGGPPPGRRASWSERGAAARRAVLPMLSPLFIVGGIVSGAITPTEAGVGAALYALVLCVAYRGAGLREIVGAVCDAALGAATPLFIITTALLFSWIVTVEQVPQMLLQALGGLLDRWLVIVLLINVIMLVLGMFVDGIAIMILMVPVLKPIALVAQVDLVHLGVVMTINTLVGAVTPPVGMLAFVAADIAECPVEHVFRSVAPFLLPLMAGLLFVSLVPETVTWLPYALLR